MDNEIRVSEMKKLKPDECGLVYDEVRGILIAVCNKDGKLSILKRRIEDI